MKTVQVNMHEAKTRLSQLGENAWSGVKVVIAKSGKPYLDLLPHKVVGKPRKPGRYIRYACVVVVAGRSPGIGGKCT